MRSRTRRFLFHGGWFLLVCAACGASVGASAHRTDGMVLVAFARPLTTECGGKAEPNPEHEILGVTPPWLAEDASTAANSPRVPPRRCTADEECCPGFCDRGVCSEVVPKRAYGLGCEFAPVAPEPPSINQLPGPIGGISAPCGAYICHQGRCRSCQSDADCGANTKCVTVEGWPRKSCNGY